MRKLTGTIVVLLLAATPLTISACGGGGGGKAGGSIRVAHSSFPDFLDPGLSYTVDGWEALNLAYTGLVAYQREGSLQDTATVVPGLAQDLPKISPDGKTYDFQLRKGLKFSDGKPVKASDFKASIERILKMDSPGAGLGYTNIVGGEKLLESKKGGLDGIKADDATGKITINLEQPRGPFLYELAIPFASLVPGDTPAKNQTKDPPPGTGRYMFKSVEPGRGYTLVKNPNFSDALKGTAADSGKVNQIDAVVQKEENSVTQISQNKLDFMVDNPPADRAAEVKSKYGGKRFNQFTTNSTFYFFMNTETKPFDNLKVRQAVNYAIDPEAINRVQGGVISPTNEILPPGVPGHKDTPNLYPHNVAKAKALIKEAGVEGDKVTVWGNPENPTKQTVEYYADVLNGIGLKADTKIISGETYFTTIGDRSVKAQTGWANWFQDYPHPADFIDILLNPDNVVATGNNNYSYNTKDKKLAAMINAVVKEPELTDEVKDKWAAIDLYVQQQAYWAIYGNRKQSTFFSDRLNFDDCKGISAIYTHDWSRFCLK